MFCILLKIYNKQPTQQHPIVFLIFLIYFIMIFLVVFFFFVYYLNKVKWLFGCWTGELTKKIKK